MIGLVLDISCEVSSKADDDDFQFRVRHALRYFIQDSHILKIDPTCSSFCQNLLNILDRKHWGLLEPLIDHPKTFTPLLVFLSQNGNSDLILAAFCVECEMFETKQSSLNLIVESKVLTKLFEQFEVKHGCRNTRIQTKY